MVLAQKAMGPMTQPCFRPNLATGRHQGVFCVERVCKPQLNLARRRHGPSTSISICHLNQREAEANVTASTSPRWLAALN